MKFLIKLHPEIMVKSKSVRQRLTKMLAQNIRSTLRLIDVNINVRQEWDCLVVSLRLSAVAEVDAVVAQLQRIPGIHSFAAVNLFEFKTLDDLLDLVTLHYRDRLHGHSFWVRVKRKGEHPFSSVEAARYLGGGLLQRTTASGVHLTQPDVEIKLEINQNQVRLATASYSGLGGFPLGSQEDVLSLISGGFDSGVASYQMIKKGIRTHYCFFNLGGAPHQLGVQSMAYQLWHQYSVSHKVRFVEVNFADLVAELVQKVAPGFRGVVLKYCMLQVASRIAERLQIPALVTGDSVGQVSSQTLTNLNAVNGAADVAVLRPLITLDKDTIVQQSRQLGLDKLAAAMPEFCGAISHQPNIKTKRTDIEAQVALLSADWLDTVLTSVQVHNIKHLAKAQSLDMDAVLTCLSQQAVVIDIRTPEEQARKPLPSRIATTYQSIPFYRLRREFAQCDPTQEYVLYCEHGMMSQMQALYLQEQGYSNVKALRLSATPSAAAFDLVT